MRSKRKRRHRSTLHRVYELLRPVLLDRCWSMDFVCDQLFDGRGIRILTIIETPSRKYMAIGVGQSLKSCRVVEVFEQIKIRGNPLPLNIQVDNGLEFISKELDKWAYENNIQLLFSRSGKLTDNAFIESFNGSLHDECVNVNWFLSIEDAKAKIEIWREEYNHYRPHMALDGCTPDEIAEKIRKKHYLCF